MPWWGVLLLLVMMVASFWVGGWSMRSAIKRHADGGINRVPFVLDNKGGRYYLVPEEDYVRYITLSRTAATAFDGIRPEHARELGLKHAAQPAPPQYFDEQGFPQDEECLVPLDPVSNLSNVHPIRPK